MIAFLIMFLLTFLFGLFCYKKVDKHVGIVIMLLSIGCFIDDAIRLTVVLWRQLHHG